VLQASSGADSGVSAFSWSWSGVLSSIMSTLAEIWNDIKSESGGALLIYEELESRIVSSLELTGPSQTTLNLEVLLVIGVVLGAGVLGKAADACLPASSTPDRPSCTVAAILVASYGILLPGIFCNLFVFVVGVTVWGIEIMLSNNPDGEPGQMSESTWSIIEVLLQTGGYPGAVLLITYAIVIPVLKLLMLAFAECYRGSESITCRRWSRNSIIFVQFISKWACPDMFAYMLLVYLFRQVNDSSPTISMPSELRIGFTCFTTFCVASTLSTLAIKPPEVSLDDENKDEVSEAFALRWIGLEYLPLAVSLMTACCLSALAVGMTLSCLSLTFSEETIAETYGIPAWLCSLFGLGDISATVSLWETCLAMTHYALSGEATCLVAALMLLVFVLGMIIADVITLLMVAICLRWAALGNMDHEMVQWASEAMAWASCFKHISMLDVFIMGILVVGAAGQSYDSYGVVLRYQWGLVPLVAAEVMHYVTYYLVHGAVDCLEKDAVRQAAVKGKVDIRILSVFPICCT